MIFLQIPEMDMSNRTLYLLFLIVCINSVSAGLEVPQPADLEVNILDGDVIVIWKHPVNAPSNPTYNVQMTKLNGEWNEVQSCTGITETFCDLSRLIPDYHNIYKVKVQLVAGDESSQWKHKKINPKDSQLQPPSFSLLATSSSLSVSVHPKPILKKIFSYGVIYTIYLEDTEKENKTTTAFLTEDEEDDQRTHTFKSLHWGREYCVSMKVEGKGALFTSSVSPRQCLLLPEREWFAIAVSSLSILGVLAITVIIVIILLCYLRRPEKTPAALKSPASYWLPLSVGEGAMEVVTDKGWFLSSYGTEVKNCVKVPVTRVTVTEDNETEDRRTSMDSGVSVESSSATNNRGSPLMRQEDSGCGSLGGPESSTSSQTVYPLQDERTDTDIIRKREDSGVGLGCQLDSFSVNLDGQDSMIPKEPVPGGNYRTQSPSAVQIRVCDDEEPFKQILPDTVLAEVVTGYRAGPQLCICSGAGQCTWCHKQGHYGSEVIKQYRALCIENGPLSSKCVDSYKRGLIISSYSSKSQMETVTVDNFEKNFTQLGETFPLLTTLSPLSLVEEGHDFNMNNVSLSLCDVQLTTD